MSQLLLPATINPPRFRKDGSCSIVFDSRELNSEEIMTILGFKDTEGWLAFAPNQHEVSFPKEPAHLENKTPSERLRNVLYVYYKQQVDAGQYVGLFESFRAEKMEKIIEWIKQKLHE